MLSHSGRREKKEISRKFGVHLLYRTPRNFVARLTPLWRHNNVKFQNELSHDKTNKMTVHPPKTQISLGIRPV